MILSHDQNWLVSKQPALNGLLSSAVLICFLTPLYLRFLLLAAKFNCHCKNVLSESKHCEK